MMTKKQKEELVKDLSHKLADEKASVFFDFTGLNFKKMQELKKELKKKNVVTQIIKKTLLKLVLKNAKREAPVEDFKGSVAVAYSKENEMAPSSIVYKFSKLNTAVKILGGIFNKKFINSDEVIKIARLPSKEQAIANLISLLQNNIRSVMYILQNIKK